MADDPTTSSPFSLKRWSQRKLAAARKAESDALASPATAPVAVPVATPAVAPAVLPESVPLPPVESLTFDSDFAAFMQPKVDEVTKRAALKKLFTDPSFNVMDGLDIYVGDYTQADPMPEGMLERLSAVYKMLDPVEPSPEEAKAVADDIAPSAGAVPVADTMPPAEALPAAETASAAEAAIAANIAPAVAAAAPVNANPCASDETSTAGKEAAKPA